MNKNQYSLNQDSIFALEKETLFLVSADEMDFEFISSYILFFAALNPICFRVSLNLWD